MAQSICILRLSAIGDVCHAVAMVERIQRMAPDMSVTWVIGKIEYMLVKDLPGVEFIIFDKREGKAAFTQLKKQLAEREFDALLLMQVALRANLAARMIKAKIKIGFDWQRSKELHWLFANRRIAAQQHPHVLDGFMAFADALGVPDGGPPRWHIPITAESSQFASQLMAELGEFVVISPAASKPERNWLPSRYAQVADYLTSQGIAVVLCGGPGQVDRQLGDEIMQACEHPPYDLIGKTSLNTLLAVLQQARLVIAPDTGPAHMATTVGTPVIGLYAHSNPRRTGPYNNLGDVVSVYEQVVEQQRGKSWTALPWGVRAKGADLMAAISVESVLARVKACLS